jgi:hypothetical protein
MSEKLTIQEQRDHAAAVEAALEAIQTALEGSVASNGYFDVTYQFPVDFDGNDTQVFTSHPTLRGIVLDFALHTVSEALDSAAETVVVGSNADNDCYASIAIGATVAIGASRHPAVVQGVTSIIPAGSTVEVENSTAGSTGIGVMALTVRYFP